MNQASYRLSHDGWVIEVRLNRGDVFPSLCNQLHDGHEPIGETTATPQRGECASAAEPTSSGFNPSLLRLT